MSYYTPTSTIRREKEREREGREGGGGGARLAIQYGPFDIKKGLDKVLSKPFNGLNLFNGSFVSPSVAHQ